MPAQPSPGLDVTIPGAEARAPSVLRRGWFWVAATAVVAATVVVVVQSSRGSAPPATDLGNQAFQP